MRRTFQDLARAAEVKDIVTRAVSGHATETMQQHYSTVNAEEMRAGIAKVIDLAGVRKALEQQPVVGDAEVVGKVVGSDANEKGRSEASAPTGQNR